MKKRTPFTTLATGLVDLALDKAARGLQSLLRGKKPLEKSRITTTPSSWRTAEKNEETPVVTVSEVSRTVQLFLSFSHLDGYVSPFLKLECVQKRPDADAVATVLNHAMCVMRYICQSDVAFCEGALERMINLVEMHENMVITFTDAWINGCLATQSHDFLAHFKDNPHEAWQHQYVVQIRGDAGFDEIISQIQALYYTRGYPCTEIGSGIAHDEMDRENWLAACAAQMRDAEHRLVSLAGFSNNDRCLTLLRPLEINVLRGMLCEFCAENVDQVVEVAGRMAAQPE